MATKLPCKQIAKSGQVYLTYIFSDLFRNQADFNSFPLGELEETTGTPPYYVDEDYPAGPGITEPLPERSN